MSSKLRETTSRRRRALAAPFVLTAALSGGCYIQPDPQPQQPGYGQQPAPAQPTAQPEQPPTEPTQPPTVMTNPPPPGATDRERPVTDKPAPPTSGGKVVTRADGSCWWQPEMPDCPPNVACNPPRPHEVACPTK